MGCWMTSEFGFGHPLLKVNKPLILSHSPFYSQCVASSTKTPDPIITSTIITTVTVTPTSSGVTYITVTTTVTATSK